MAAPEVSGTIDKTAVMAIGQKAVGETVKIDVGGTATEFIVVHQGNPDPALYDISCTGTWLLSKDCLAEGPWAATNTNAYLKCTALTALKDVVQKFPAAVVQQFKMAKIPYCGGGGNSTVKSGTNGMATKMFLLSEYEVGYTNSISSYIPVDGAKLDYFDSGNGGSSKRIANYNGSALGWWTRSPLTVSNYQSWRITNEGFGSGESTSGYHGIRPAFIMPFNAAVSEDGYLTGNTVDMKLGSLPVGSVVNFPIGGKATDFIIVHQGIPDASVYDSSCYGTWLLKKDYEDYCGLPSDSLTAWYDGSAVLEWLNGDFTADIDTDILTLAKNVLIPYYDKNGLHTGENGLESMFFLLGSYECGYFSDYSRDNVGAVLDYFKTSADTKRIYTKQKWWTRTHADINGSIWMVENNGGMTTDLSGTTIAVRPACIMPMNCSVDGNMTISAGNGKTKLSDLVEGSTIQIMENGKNVDFYVAKHDYESELNGTGRTLVVRKQCYDKRKWNDSRTNGYATSAIDTWLNNTYKNLLDSSIQKAISTTKFKYTIGNGNTSVATLERSAFLLSMKETGISSSSTNDEGTELPIANLISSSLTIGTDVYYWTRTPSINTNDNYRYVYVRSSSTANKNTADSSLGSRPAFTLPAEVVITETGEVVVNTAPTVTCRDGASGVKLGTKTSPWNFKYVPLDEDGDALTVKEKLDGVVKKTRTNVASGTELTFELASTAAGFQKILNGSHTITIEVSDGTETTEFTATFDKAVYKAKITLTKPLAVAGDITVAIMAMVGQIPGDAKYTIEATNNAKDANPVWQDVTSEVDNSQNIVFKNHVVQNGSAFAFRITIERGSSNTGGYISAVTGAFQ